MDIKKIIEEIKSKENYTIEDLRNIMIVLRSENGCPWDRVQTHKSVRQDLLEEAYEAAEAIDCEDDGMLCEELGDVLLQVVFHSNIAEQEGRFSFDDVADGVSKKMIERHPHVFGDVEADTVDDVLTNWDSIKQASKKRKGIKTQLDGVCKALPSLMLASKYANKCIKSGINIKTKTVIDSVSEEEIGNILFDIAVISSKNKIDPELALQRKCQKFLSELDK